MMDLLMRVEASGLSTWLRESQSLWAFPFVLAVHTVGLGLAVGSTVVVDLRILGGASRIPLKPLEKFFSIMWVGFALNVVWPDVVREGSNHGRRERRILGQDVVDCAGDMGPDANQDEGLRGSTRGQNSNE